MAKISSIKNAFLLRSQVLAQSLLTDELVALEGQVSFILNGMERGFKVDVAALTDLKNSYDGNLSTLQNEIEENLGRGIRSDSNRDLAELLFGQLALPSLKKTQNQSNSVSLSVLDRLEESYGCSHPFLKPLVEYKRLQPISKAIKTIFKKLDADSRIHPEFNQSGCPTGRIYSYIQNLPKKARKALVPDEDRNVFIELDWSQQELRILGALSGEPVFLDCFSRNEDLHKRVIAEMFHKSLSDITAEERKLGKTINFGLIYGQEAPGLAWKLNVTIERAQELIDQYFLSLPLIKKFKEESEARFWKEGYAETAFGRRTTLNLKSGDIKRELRRGFNHQIQGTGADLLKMALISLYEGLRGKMARLKFCSHDAIYLESPKEISLEMADHAKSIMEIDFKGVKLPVSIKIHPDFSMGEGNP